MNSIFATASVSTHSGSVNTAITFNPSGTYDLSGSGTGTWAFGDGQTLVDKFGKIATKTVQHSYAKSGSYAVSWTVVDNSIAPVQTSSIPAAPTGVTLTAVPNASSLVLTLKWTASPGAATYNTVIALNQSPWTVFATHNGITGTTDSISVTLPLASTKYYACVSAVNSAGASPNACSSITYTPPIVPVPVPTNPFVAVISSPTELAQIAVGQPVTFDSSGSYSPSGSVTATWNFGDSFGATGPTVKHCYITTGDYTAILTVKDIAGNTTASYRHIKII